MTPLLMISYEAPPRLTANGIFCAKLLKGLPPINAKSSDEPLRIDLICASPVDEAASDPELESLLPESIQVHRVDPLPRGRRTIIQRIIGGLGGWHLDAAHKAAALFPAEHKKPALIYSLSHPPASHLLALELVNGPFQGVPWVAHFTRAWSQDPSIESPMTRAALARHERKVVKMASRLIFVNEALRDLMLPSVEDQSNDEDRQWAQGLHAKSRIIPHVLDASLFGKNALPNTLTMDPNKITIAHVGGLQTTRRSEPIFAAFTQLRQLNPELADKIRFWLAGPIDEQQNLLAQASRMHGYVQYTGQIAYGSSLAVMENADVLLVLDTPSRSRAYFPSKIVEYLGARKPILAITHKNSFVANIMAQWKQPCFEVADIESVAACLKRIASRELWPPPPPSAINSFIGSQVSAQFAEILTEVINVHAADNGSADQNSNP